jgi:hypothetical protein
MPMNAPTFEAAEPFAALSKEFVWLLSHEIHEAQINQPESLAQNFLSSRELNNSFLPFCARLPAT